MTTITLETKLRLTKTSFKDEVELLKYLAVLSNDYNDPEFHDTILTPEIEVKANKAREQLKNNPASFHRSLK